jgi:hypothetical protein
MRAGRFGWSLRWQVTLVRTRRHPEIIDGTFWPAMVGQTLMQINRNAMVEGEKSHLLQAF